MDIRSIIKSSLTSFIMAIVRNLLVTALTWLVAQKWIDEAAGNQMLAYGPVVITAVLWSVIEKYILAKIQLEKLLTALNLAPGSTLAHLDEAVRKQKTVGVIEENTK